MNAFDVKKTVFHCFKYYIDQITKYKKIILFGSKIEGDILQEITKTFNNVTFLHFYSEITDDHRMVIFSAEDNPTNLSNNKIWVGYVPFSVCS